MTQPFQPPPVPPPDEVTAPWWDATREHRLVLQSCGACSHVQHPPRAVCTACSSMDHLTFVDAAGTGTIDAHTTIHRPPRPDLAAPYTVARVRLDEGPILLTRLEGDDDGWTIGDLVRVAWVDLDDGRALPVFTSA